MQAQTTRANLEARSSTLAGLPLTSWSFAVRIWLAILLALYVSFWLELEVPSTAAITVAILALPTRAQGLEKAAFRLMATAIGVAASVAIAGIFSQTDVLLLCVFGLWVGLCVYLAGLFDGNRAYAAALCCITVALIAIQQIDSPQLVFPTGIARGAAITIGVLAIALVNDTLAAPDYHPILADRLEALLRRVTDYASPAARGGLASAISGASLLSDIAAVRPEIASLSTESSSGAARSSAASSALVNLVNLVALARWLELLARTPLSPTSGTPGVAQLIADCRSWLETEFVRVHEEARDSLSALRDGRDPTREFRLPFYRSRRVAAEGGVRAAIHFALIAGLLAAAGWPTTEVCLSLVAVIIGLSATAPDPRAFTAIAVIATPIACLLAGILRYFVFNGVSEFQLLAIGLAPVVIGLALLISLPNPLLSALGRLTLVFTLAIFAPSNPQSYDPLTFLITCLLAAVASTMAFAAQLLLPPLSPDRRLQILLDEMYREPEDLRATRDLAPAEIQFRDATRIATIRAAAVGDPMNQATIEEGMGFFDRAAILRRSRVELECLTIEPLASAAKLAQASLGYGASTILAAARDLHDAADQDPAAAKPACATLVLASAVLLRSAKTTRDAGALS